MGHEVELKLALAPDQQTRLMRHPLLKSASSRTRTTLRNIYYDTSDLALHRHGIALRLRKQDKHWLQTVKCVGSAAGGLSSRPEWETPYAEHFDFSAVTDPKLRKWLCKVLGRLLPVFQNHVRRTAWQIAPNPGSLIEVVLDRGWLEAAGERQPISEVEIELQHGDVSQLIGIAEHLADRIPLLPAVLSKAERGYRLFLKQPETPVTAASLKLAPQDAPLAAFEKIAFSCIDQLQQNHHGAVAQDEPEFIHQMRVATRRLRAAFQIFKPALPGDAGSDLLPELIHLMRLLGAARDLDVIEHEVVLPVARALPEDSRIARLLQHISSRRVKARSLAIEALQEPAYGRLLLRLIGAFHSFAGMSVPDLADVGMFSAKRVKHLHRDMCRRAASAKPEDIASLHALRIAIKRLRYALEFFHSLLEGKRCRALMHDLGHLQDELGKVNDLARAGALLNEIAGDDPALREALAQIGGWHAERHHEILAGIPKALRRLKESRLPRPR